MKRKTNRGGKLSLNRATLRALTGAGLRAAQGGTDRYQVAYHSQQTLTCDCFIMKDSIIVRTSG